MTITVDEKLIEIARCLADSAATLSGTDMRVLAAEFASAASVLLAQAVKSSETVKFVG
jgi:hypothetical protein